jgi:hypothetical protein
MCYMYYICILWDVLWTVCSPAITTEHSAKRGFIHSNVWLYLNSNLQQLSLLTMVPSGMLRRVALVRTDVSEELGPSFIRVTRIRELGTTLALTSNRRTLRRNTKWERKLEWNSELWIQMGWGEKIVAWVVNGPRQSEVPSFGWSVGRDCL